MGASRWISTLQSRNIEEEFRALASITDTKHQHKLLVNADKYAMKNRYCDILPY